MRATSGMYMYYQTQIFKPMCNVGSEPQKATDDPGEKGDIIYCILREEGGKRERHRMPVPVVWMPATCCVDRTALVAWGTGRYGSSVLPRGTCRGQSGCVQFRGREWNHDAAPPRSAASEQPRPRVRPSDPCGRRGAVHGSSWGATTTKHVARWPTRATCSWSGRRSAPRSGR